MKKKLLIVAVLLLQSFWALAQVAINADGSAPDASAGLDISYSNKGLLIPRLSFTERNAIQTPAQGLIVYCTDCSANGKGALSIFEGTSWKILDFKCDVPVPPLAGNNLPSTSKIIWNWQPSPISLGYRISSVNDYASATVLGNLTTYSDSNLSCNTLYTRYVWAYNECGHCAPLILQAKTEEIPITSAPDAGSHSSFVTSITWKWFTMEGATGYKWNTSNDYNSAQDLGDAREVSESGLICGTEYTRFFWGYNDCGHSPMAIFVKSTLNVPAESPEAAEHVPDSYSVVWRWHPVSEASGYRWHNTDDFESALNVNLDTFFVENNLPCFTPVIRYIWAYNNCGVSVAVPLYSSTTSDVHPAPTPAGHIPSAFEVTWNWHPLVNHFSEFKWNTVPDFNSAINLNTDTTYTETGLKCNTAYTRYVWGYDNCAVSSVIELRANTNLYPPANPAEGSHSALFNQITWTWLPVENATGYKWSTTNNFNSAVEMGTDTSFAENGLTCNTNYTRFIWAYSDCGVSPSTEIHQMSALNPPPAPTPAAHQTYPTMIVWNWNPVQGATGYKWGLSSNLSEAQEMGSNTSKLEAGLTCNTDYTRYVWAYGPCGTSDAAVLIQSSAVDPPQNPNAGTHVPGPFEVEWHWFAVAGATGYKFGLDNNYQTATDVGTQISRLETGLDCNTGYTRYVWSYNNCGQSAAVSLAQNTSLYPPVAPSAGTHSPGPFEINWSWDPVNDAEGYKWNTSNNQSTATDLGNETSFPETGLNCNSAYTRYVWAYNSCGTSPARSLSQTTSLFPPAAPTTGSNTATASQIVWNWTPVSGATGYKWNTTNSLTGAQDMFASTSKTENGLNCNTGYTRYVWAYSSCGTSEPLTINYSTTIYTPTAPVAGTHVPSNIQVVWNWGAVSGATGYKWSTSNNYATAVNVNNALTYTENNLTCGTNYTRYVWAYNACAYSPAAILSSTTTSVAPSATTEGSHVAYSTQVIWNWTSVPAATSYKWNTVDNIATATDIGNVLTRTETGLNCATSYTRYIWAIDQCSNSPVTTLSKTTLQLSPNPPSAGTHTIGPGQIVWHWNNVTDAAGYKWSTTNSYTNATDMGTSLSHSESGLACLTNYTRFVWAYNNCGVSTSLILNETTSNDPPATPTAGTQVPAETQVVWNWNEVVGAAGYKWNTENNYTTAIEMNAVTTRTETGIACNTSFTRYVWAYTSCGYSTPVALTATTTACWQCGTVITVYHVVDNVAPEVKTVNYGTVTSVPGETTKCWITRNLGASQQATAVNDNTEASSGWYFQFNKPQGFKHDGTTRTPNTTWITSISDYSDWVTANDPCAIEIGTGWRIPTITEWTNVDAAGPWTNWTHPFASLLKMHASGRLDYSTGNISERGFKGSYWSATQYGIVDWGQILNFSGSSCITSQYQKAYGYPLRCVKN